MKCQKVKRGGGGEENLAGTFYFADSMENINRKYGLCTQFMARIREVELGGWSEEINMILEALEVL